MTENWDTNATHFSTGKEIREFVDYMNHPLLCACWDTAHGNIDKVAREIVLPSSPALKELSDAFGEDIILSDGSLDRKALAQRAFSSREKTELLNSITHPHLKRRCQELLAEGERESFAVAVRGRSCRWHVFPVHDGIADHPER